MSTAQGGCKVVSLTYRPHLPTGNFDKLLYTEEPKELLKIGNREINEFDVEVLTALKRKSVALKRACCGEDEE